MGDYELHFAEEGRAPFGLRLRLPNEWTRKTARDLASHFIETYNRTNGDPLTGAYGLVDVRTGRFYADDAPLAEVAHDAPLSVARRDPPVEEEVDAEYTLEDAGSDEPDAVDDEEPLEDLVAIGAFGGGYARSRARLRAALRRRRVSVADIVAESASEDASVASSSSSDESEDDEEDYRPTAPQQQRKDWGAINYKKALCPDMVAGRKCPHGAACTYAHSYDELRVVEKPGKPHVCVGDSTAAFELAPPEYWQMGTFAEAGRQGPHLWARLAKGARYAVAAPSVRIRAGPRDAMVRDRISIRRVEGPGGELSFPVTVDGKIPGLSYSRRGNQL